MSSTTLVQAAIFTVGALVGGGVTAALTTRKAPVAALPPPSVPAVVQVGPSGQAQMMMQPVSPGMLEPVLKYGNPGACRRA
jgi:endonuclease G